MKANVIVVLVSISAVFGACKSGGVEANTHADSKIPTPTATAVAAPPVRAPASCADLLSYSDVFAACGVPGSLNVESHVFDGIPVCGFALARGGGQPDLTTALHAVVRRYPSADAARSAHPLDERAPNITTIAGLGDAAIHYTTADPKAVGATVAFRRGALSGFVETEEHACSRQGLERIATVLLNRMHDGAGAP